MRHRYKLIGLVLDVSMWQKANRPVAGDAIPHLYATLSLSGVDTWKPGDILSQLGDLGIGRPGGVSPAYICNLCGGFSRIPGYRVRFYIKWKVTARAARLRRRCERLVLELLG